MAAFYLIATLIVLQGLLFSYCETTGNVTMSTVNVQMSTVDVTMSTGNVIGSNTLPTAVQATPSLGGNETTTIAGGTVTPVMGGDTVTTAVGGGTVTTAVGDTVTIAAGGGGGGTSVTTAMGGGGTATVTTEMGGAGTAAVTTVMGVGGTGTVTTVTGGGGTATVTTVMGGGGTATVTTVMGVGGTATVTSVMGGGGGGTVTTVAGGGGISSSKTTTTTTSSVAPEKEPGPTVILILIVTTTCSGDNLLALNVSVQNDIKTVYSNEGFSIKSVITQSISCSNSAINITLELLFYSGIPSGKTIKGVFQAALKGKKITNLTESNTIFTVTFTGVTLKYNPKAGQCQAICCGGGGALTVERECTPDDKCKGIEPDEKKEKGHCPKEEKGTCPDKCDEDDGSGGIHNSPSYALVTLLAIATFKMMFF